jgi:hypothetical protein
MPETTIPTWTVNTPSSAWVADRQKRELVELILAGTEAVRGNCGDGSRSDGILRRETGESPEAFNRRRDQSELVNYLADMIEDHTNRIFRRPPAFGADVPVEITGKDNVDGTPEIVGWAENIDNAETHWSVFSRGLYQEAKKAGGVGVLVDMAPAPPGERTAEDKKASGRRPYCVKVTADAAIEMTARTVRGVQRLAALRYRETLVTKTAPYDPGTVVEFVREYHDGLDDAEATRLNPGVSADHPAFYGVAPDLVNGAVLEADDPRRLATFKLWKVAQKKDEADELVDSGAMKPFRRIPYVWVQINEGEKYRSTPPQETTALAKTTREHFRKKSGIDSYMRRANGEFVYRKNHDPEALAATAGPQDELSTHNYYWDPPGNDADMKFVGPEGKSLTQSRSDLAEVEARAKEQANEPLLPNRGNLTATEADLRNRKANSKLEGQVLRLCDGLEQVLDLMMQWVEKAPGSGGSLVPDLQDLTTAPPDTAFAEVVAMGEKGLLPRAKVIQEAIRFRRISEDSDPAKLLAEADAEKAKTPEAQVLTALTAARLGDRTSSFVSERTFLARLAEFGVLPSDLKVEEEIKRLAEERTAGASEGGPIPASPPVVDKLRMPVVAM